jgi:hypothetical protein
MLISPGQAPNTFIRALLHFTINPDGTITSFSSTFSEECKGRGDS